MPIDFHDEQNRHMYAVREANEDWEAMIESIVTVKGKEIADIGCGGGIYTSTLADMGAARVTGVDSSKVMLAEAQSTLVGYNNISYVLGNALNTGLLGEQYDIILER
ncbi:MAG: class I SAM-dependent methyltransferase, partial [Chloroflexi bacterium]|nr:class I SAM-dependent methyltransferase [Chloroflexota bacterium]